MDRDRIGRDLGLNGVQHWLQETALAESRSVRVRQVRIACPSVSELSKRQAAQFRRLRSRNQSALHCYLKLAAKLWLEMHGKGEGRVLNERGYYTPGLLAGMFFHMTASGRRVDLAQPRFLTKWNRFPLNEGRKLRFDLATSKTIMEVGATRSENLLRPLLDGVVQRSVWIPFPHGSCIHEFVANGHSLSEIAGYEIKLVPLRKRRLRGLILKTNSGRLKIV